MKANEYRVMRMAVENALQRFLCRSATKHVEWSHWETDEARKSMADHASDAVVNELCEWFDFEDPGDVEF